MDLRHTEPVAIIIPTYHACITHSKDLRFRMHTIVGITMAVQTLISSAGVVRFTSHTVAIVPLWKARESKKGVMADRDEDCNGENVWMLTSR